MSFFPIAGIAGKPAFRIYILAQGWHGPQPGGVEDLPVGAGHHPTISTAMKLTITLVSASDPHLVAKPEGGQVGLDWGRLLG